MFATPDDVPFWFNPQTGTVFNSRPPLLANPDAEMDLVYVTDRRMMHRYVD